MLARQLCSAAWISMLFLACPCYEWLVFTLYRNFACKPNHELQS